MIKNNYISTLFVGIDISSKSNVVYAMDFDKTKYMDSSFQTNPVLINLLKPWLHV